ncbi:MAG TPA: sigma-54 dependent transcriptional regulator [Myxococcales bacterium LLY-WYZ-16_1]|nr:sigma-54 dependent transcriptional regulator [Myxococcales bacterium LLY-WYZ-16_1]
MSAPVRVLVVDDEESLRHMLSLSLSKSGYHVWTAASGQEGMELLRRHDPFDVCLTDVRMPGLDGLAFIQDGLQLKEAPTFIAMSAYGDEQLAVEAVRRGAFDYVSKPFETDDLTLKLRLIVERRRHAHPHKPAATGLGKSAAPSFRAPPGIEEVVSVSPAFREVLDVVRKVSRFPTTVLLTGETGTGKERVAGALHSEGPRASKPFVPVNCAAIPDALLESELFGHAQGAFTDAHSDRAGLFEAAHGGTLFLDEVAELPTALQVKLLRALVEKEIRRVGDSRTIAVDVRVVAATSQDLGAMVKDGRFREDLYYRLNVVRIELPPLRARPEDVRALAEHFVRAIGERLGFRAPSIAPEAMKILAGYHWPGNVRELENVIERALVLSDHEGRIGAGDLDERFDARAPATATEDLPLPVEGDELSLKVVLPRVERQLIRRALEQTGGNRTRAAGLLGVSQRALLYKLKEHGIT